MRVETVFVLGLASGLIALGVGTGFAEGSTATLDDSLTRTVSREVARMERRAPTVRVGVRVVEVGSGAPHYEHRADELFIAASNTKLATTAAALDALGPGYFFETRLLARGPVEDGVLRGDLAVVGGGDPGISWRPYPWPDDPFGVFRRWAAAMAEIGVREVEGGLLLVHGRFPRPWVHPGWKEENRLKWYQVPVAALGFHENVLQLRAHPGERSGRPAEVELRPPVPGFEPLERVVTTSSWRRHGLRVDQLGGGPVRVSGGVHRSARHLDAYVAVDDPVTYFGRALLVALEEEGLTVTGGPRPVESLPGLTWRPVAVHRSDLLTAVEITNRESQNLYAESLIKVLGAETCGRGTWERGVRAVEGFLSQVGLEPGSYQLADGSGLSRANRFTPRQLTRLLRFMHGHRWGAELRDSLPRGGEPGTSLEDRLTEPRYGSRVAAKTGTLDGVSALSGYVWGRSGRLYAVSVLVNGGAVWRARRLQDTIVRTLVDHG